MPAKPTSLGDMSRFTAGIASVAGSGYLIYRTGYVGKDRFKLMCPSHEAVTVRNAFHVVQLCGLGTPSVLCTETRFFLPG